MSISPPSDIVLDVARAADPSRYRQAAARLGSAGEVAGEAFHAALANEAPKPLPPRLVSGGQAGAEGKAPAAADKANRDFEAMVLANLLEAAMPEDGSALFGEGTAGDVWKSMLVEQIAGQMAKAGGIGIAAELSRGARTALLGTPPDPAGSKAVLIDRVERGFLARDRSDAGTTL